MVKISTKEAPERVIEREQWGALFNRTPQGRISQRPFGGHTYRRLCHVGDRTGLEMIRTLQEKVLTTDARVYMETTVTKLFKDASGRVVGALAYIRESGSFVHFKVKAVIMATGGWGRIFKVTSNSWEGTGDGCVLAYDAGAELVDMEMVQFHPTGMVWPPGVRGILVTEGVRGEGGVLRNAEGERYMERYDPERMELSTRDRIALANYTEIAEGRGTEHGGVYLDISHRPKKYILEKLPRMYRQFLEALMLDISKSPMEVAPTAHYTMGGIVVDPETHATDVEALYAAGENTSGLHGANRLGGNSLSETMVFGRRAGEAAAKFSAECDVQLRSRSAIKVAGEELDSYIKEGDEFARPLQRALRNTMQETCGVLRSEEKLNEGLERLAQIRAASEDVDVRPTSEGFGDLTYALDLRGSLVVAESTILGAIERRETRGAHNRSDYPELDPNLKVNFIVSKGDGEITVVREQVHVVPEQLEEWAKSGEEYQAAGRLVE